MNPARLSEAAQLRQIIAELIDRMENTVSWARLALTLSEREGQPPGGEGSARDRPQFVVETRRSESQR